MNEFKKSRSRYKMTFTANKLPMALAIFCSGRICERQSCPIFAKQNGVLNCHIFVRDNPDKAAELMGLEVVEVEDKDKPRLTEQELAICKAVGAKWVSRGIEPFNFVEESAQLWSDKPIHTWKKSYSIEHNTVYLLATMSAELFASVHPGDCVNVEELLKEAEQ